MSTSSSEIRDWIVDAIRDESVALAASYDYSAWASETTSHVFVGQSGFIGQRNRGRLPFFEVQTQSQIFSDETGRGGKISTKVSLRLHDTGNDIETVVNRMTETMTAALSCIRDNRENNYTQLGNDSMDEVKPGPFGWTLDATMEFEHSYDRDTYEQI